MGGGGGEVWTRSRRQWGRALGCASRGCWFWAKNPKPAHQGSVWGAPLETVAVGNGGIVGWGGRGGGSGAYVHSSTHEGEGAGAKKTRNPSHIGLVSVCIQAAAGGEGFCGISGPPAVVS